MRQRLLLVKGVLIFLIAGHTSLNASHLVGGELTYSCLGSAQYEIKLTIYRDCDTGIPYFDNPARIGIFNENDVLQFSIFIPFQGIDDTLAIVLPECNTAPANVCVHRTVYTATVFLPYLTGGYYIRHQRCCRNNDITNIINPGQSGTTYVARITEDGLMECNSSPVFNQFPPPVICVNQPIEFDHSAIDLNGDSIVYELCDPLIGATVTNPAPVIPFPPFYTPVTWVEGYGLENLLHPVLPNSLVINSATGLLTGFAHIQGRFVVSVCVREYKNGVLLGTIQRDFQYNIFLCGGPPQASFNVDDVICHQNLEAKFINTSTGQANQGITWQWDFGTGSTDPGSAEKDPLFTFPDTGTYTVTLISEPNTPCADTFQKTISVYYPSIEPDFTYATNNCDTPIVLFLQDMSIDSVSELNQWIWVLGAGQDTVYGAQAEVEISPGDFLVQLYVANQMGCKASISKAIQAELLQFGQPPDLCMIVGDTTTLQLTSDPLAQVIWGPDSLLFGENPNAPQISPESSTAFYFSIFASSGDTCNIETPVMVYVEDPIEITGLNETYYSCDAEIDIQLSTGNLEGTLNWFFSGDTTPFYTGTEPGILQVDDSLHLNLEWITLNGCVFPYEAAIYHLMAGLTFEAPDTCLFAGDSVMLSVNMHHAAGVVWWPDEFLPGSDPNMPWVAPQTTTEYQYALIFASGDTCQSNDVLTVYVDEPIELINWPLALDVCSQEAFYEANINGDPVSVYWYIHDSGIPEFSGPVFGPMSFNDSILAIIELISSQGCVLRDSILWVDRSFLTDVHIEDPVCPGDSLVITLSMLPDSTGQMIWILDGQIASTVWQPEFSFEAWESGNFSVQITNAFGCEFTVESEYEVYEDLPLAAILADPATIYLGQSTTLTAQVAAGSIFEWHPGHLVHNPGSTITDATPTETTTYGILVEDERGCISTATVTVNVLPVICRDPDIFIPTGFSPNNDGINDEWKIEAPAVDNLHAVVFDRWGRMVFETRTPDQGWNGTFEGSPLPPDVYAYRVEIQCIDGEWFIYQGNITLLR